MLPPERGPKLGPLMPDPKPIPLFTPARQSEHRKVLIQEAFNRVLDHGRFILGNEVEEFEKDFADYIGVAHCVGVTSGTDALLAILMALEIGLGDEVIVPSFTFFASAGSVARVGAKPVFADVSDCCFNLRSNPEYLESLVTPKTKAIMPVHLFGQAVDMEPILEFAEAHKLKVIEDVAQATGASWRHRRLGGLGVAGAFSFFPSKNLGALGDAGAIVTRDAELAQKLRYLRNHGQSSGYYHEHIGGNFRISALQSAFLKIKLADLDMELRRREGLAFRYNGLFKEMGLAADEPECNCKTGEVPEYTSGCLRLPMVCEKDDDPKDGVIPHAWNYYTVRVLGDSKLNRDQLREALNDEKIGSAVYYPLPLHLQPCFANLGYKEGDLPMSERLCKEVIALPLFPDMTDEELYRVVKVVSNLLS